MLARDCSNYSDLLTPEMLDGWRGQGVGLVIIQAFPQSYAQYSKQRTQMRVCASSGMPFDCYIYDYVGSPAWRDGALIGLSAAADAGLLPRKIWLDEEDITAGQTAANCVSAISASLAAADLWLEGHGRPAAGIYSAAWWWPRTGDTTAFARRELWAAQYDDVADASVFTSFGGWQECAIKQYAGSQPDGTDLNVLSAAEEAEITGGTPPVDDAERAELQGKIDGLVNSLGYISGDLLAPVVKQKNASKAVQRLVVGIQSQADANGIAHA